MTDAAAIARVTPWTVYGWLGLARRGGARASPRLPKLYQFPGIARLVQGPGGSTTPADIRAATAELLELAVIDVSPAGLIVLDRLWELGRSPSWLAGASRLQKPDVRRALIGDGAARKGHLDRVIAALKLDATSAEELRDLTQLIPEPRRWKHTATTREHLSDAARNRWGRARRLAALDAGGRTANAGRSTAARTRILDAYRRYVESYGTVPSQTTLALEAGSDPRTVRAFLRDLTSS